MLMGDTTQATVTAMPKGTTLNAKLDQHWLKVIGTMLIIQEVITTEEMLAFKTV